MAKQLKQIKTVPAVNLQTDTTRQLVGAFAVLIERHADRQRKDIANWRAALRQAESFIHPNRLPLYNVYAEIELDNHLEGLIQKGIIDRLIAQEWRIVDQDGNPDDNLMHIFKGLWFQEFIKQVVMTDFWGHSLLELGELTDDQLNPGMQTIDYMELIPRRNVSPEFGVLKVYEYDQMGWDFRTNPDVAYWFVELGRPKDLGLYNKLAPSYLMKKNSLVAHSEYCETFALPLVTATTNTRDNADLQRLRDAITNMGKGKYAIKHEGEEINIIESKGGGATAPFENMVERMNSEMSKAVVGVTMTTDSGSSLSQSQTHMEIHDDVIDSYKLKITATVMSRLVPRLMQRGLSFVGRRFEYVEQKDLGVIYERALGFLGTGQYDIAPEFINDTFGIPVTARAQQPSPLPQLPAPQADPADPAEDPTEDPNPDPTEDPKQKAPEKPKGKKP